MHGIIKVWENIYIWDVYFLETFFWKNVLRNSADEAEEFRSTDLGLTVAPRIRLVSVNWSFAVKKGNEDVLFAGGTEAEVVGVEDELAVHLFLSVEGLQAYSILNIYRRLIKVNQIAINVSFLKEGSLLREQCRVVLESHQHYFV